MKYLIFGATGYIGKYIYNRLKEDGREAVGFSRIKNEMFFFDILNTDIFELVDVVSEGDLAIIALAQTKIDECKKNYDISYEVNVERTTQLISFLNEKKVKVIYFSSDNVFGDGKGFYSENDVKKPINKYGEMKSEVEDIIIKQFENTCVLRLPKVYGVNSQFQNMLVEFDNLIKMNKPIRCIKGTKMSIISQEDVYRSCMLTYENNLSGIYNVCEDQSYSRKELAMKYCEQLGIEYNIIELSLDEFKFEDSRPTIINMLNTKFVKETSYSFGNYENNVKMYIKRKVCNGKM